MIGKTMILNVMAVAAALMSGWGGPSAESATAMYRVRIPALLRAPALEATAAWLSALNDYRAMANLPEVTENAAWSAGAQNHARYMVKNDYIGHGEDPANPWYTENGAAAAQTSNVTVSTNATASDQLALDLWMEGPFHALGILDTRLSQVGYGTYREADGEFQMGATLNVLSGLAAQPKMAFPVIWPADGKTTRLGRYLGNEIPDPLTSCAGYTAPTGLPLLMQFGTGSSGPSVTAHSFARNGESLEHCVFSETSYSNADNGAQSLGRAVLKMRNAVVLIPRAPLVGGTTYTASVTADGVTYTWSFSLTQ